MKHVDAVAGNAHRTGGKRLRAALLRLGLGLGLAGCGGADVAGTSSSSSTTGGTSTGEGTTTAVTSGGSTSTTSGDTTGAVVTSGGGSTGGTSWGTWDSGGEFETDVGETGFTDTDIATGGGTGDESTGGDTTGGEEPVVPGPKVKVMTFNIRVGTANDGENAWDKRKGLVYQVFKDQDADFVGVQEALNFQLQEIDAAVTAYDRVGIGTEDGKTKGPINAIYYKKSRFEVKKTDTFWLSDTPGVPGSQTWGNKFPRTVTWARFIEKSSQYTFYVYNTHFDHASQHSREKSAVLLAQRIADRGSPMDPFVVTGDFNAAEGNVVTRFLKENAKIDGMTTAVRLRDTFRVVKPDADNVGTAHGFSGKTGGNKIDYVFVPAKQQVHSASIDHFNKDGRYPSDHFPVVGTVTFAAK
jgi:endonuclease/exonuclease/phosphatase family metal-dependent hydrolase